MEDFTMPKVNFVQFRAVNGEARWINAHMAANTGGLQVLGFLNDLKYVSTGVRDRNLLEGIDVTDSQTAKAVLDLNVPSHFEYFHINILSDQRVILPKSKKKSSGRPSKS